MPFLAFEAFFANNTDIDKLNRVEFELAYKHV